jgi:hypothetical protein
MVYEGFPASAAFAAFQKLEITAWNRFLPPFRRPLLSRALGSDRTTMPAMAAQSRRADRDRVMFFLARCTFWLGVVAWQLPWPGAAPGVPQSGIALVRSLDAKTALADIDALCSTSPGLCAEAARRAVTEALPAVRAGLGGKPRTGPTTPAAPRRLRGGPDSSSPKLPARAEAVPPRRPAPSG